MEFKYNKNIILNKELNALDKFVIGFTSYLNKLKIKVCINIRLCRNIIWKEQKL